MVTKEEINGYFLEAIRLLKAEGYTQKDIVKAAGLSPNTISKIKTGQNNAGDDTINKLCNAFKLNPDFFYRGSKQFKMEEKERQPASAPMIDNGSAINAALAAKDETIETLKPAMHESLPWNVSWLLPQLATCHATRLLWELLTTVTNKIYKLCTLSYFSLQFLVR